MESLERFEQVQRIVDDFTSRTLAVIPGDFARLVHLAMLRDPSSGGYHHEGLETLYSPEAVQQALHYCHEEIFQRILEMPLESQERELRRFFAGQESGGATIAEHWLELGFYRLLMPLGTPEYLRDLFCSNLRALLELLAGESATTSVAA